jgi:hypothetical protein
MAYHGARRSMSVLKHAFASVLLGWGVALVFAGLSSARGFTVTGILASLAAIATLLYAGGVWFGGAPLSPAPVGSPRVVVFDPLLRVAAGTGARRSLSLLSLFPKPLRPEIELRCRAALRGEHAHFVVDHAGARVAFDITPLPTTSGKINYGVLISGTAERVPDVAGSPLPTVP